ncbi:hypothetical protein CSW30_02605 [Thermus scotoductus]|uniref:Uncharacterized protein n=1 Tax=Thermus scotoductus TaxID=37636 RepID=A0A430USB1_THESC|nr:hypothetical protein CSW30_02605 [Thermus scotoductus]
MVHVPLGLYAQASGQALEGPNLLPQNQMVVPEFPLLFPSIPQGSEQVGKALQVRVLPPHLLQGGTPSARYPGSQP